MRKNSNVCKDFVSFFVVFVFCINIVGCNSTIAANKQISQGELIQLIEGDKAPLILDVRNDEEYLESHVPGAINIEYRELPSRIDDIRKLGNQKIIVYCERGVRANIAEDTLKKAGFTEVLHLEGDMSGWRNEGLEVERG